MVTSYDMCQMSSATTGTGTITLSTAVAGFQTLNGIVPNNVVISYGITDTSNAWEVGQGTYTNTAGVMTLTRGAIYSSAGAATAISLSGVASIYVTTLAEDINTLVVANSVYVGNSTANITGNTTVLAITNSISTMSITPSSLSAGNSTANSFSNSIIDIVANSTSQTVITPLNITIGNSTANTLANSIVFAVGSSAANTLTLTPTAINVGAGTTNVVANTLPAIVVTTAAANAVTINSTSVYLGTRTSNTFVNTLAFNVTTAAANTITITSTTVKGPVAYGNVFMGGSNSITVIKAGNVVVNGFSALVNGLKMNWGTGTVNSAGVVATYSQAFTTNTVTFGVCAGPPSTLLIGANTPYILNANASTITLGSAITGAAAQTATYWAIGI